MLGRFASRRSVRVSVVSIVAHRPSTVMLADRVALLEDGRITAVGTHSELLHESDHYRFVISSLEVDERRAQAEASDRIDEDEGLAPRSPEDIAREEAIR